MADEVLYELVDGGIAVVTLNRPEKRNAVNAAMAQAIADAVRRTERDPGVRVVVLTSSNDRVFCAGADLAAAAEGSSGASLPESGFAGFVYANRRKPWIAAVRGFAVAGGLEICLACDMIVASSDARFGLPEPKRGLIAGAGGLTRLPRVIAKHVAIEMITTGEPIDAARAHALGLVNRVVAADQVLDAALAIARSIVANAPIAVQESLALARRAAELDDAAGRACTDEAVARLRTTEDFKEGPRAFLEKRAPVWKGR
jgi:enoyl-CoA hydratase/carnithine racemase